MTTVAERAAWLLLLITMGIALKESSGDLSVLVLYAFGVAHGAALVALYSRTTRVVLADSKKTDETPRPVLKGASAYKPPAAEITMSVDDFESLRSQKANRRKSVSGAGTPGSRKSPRTPKSASRQSPRLAAKSA